MKKSLLLTVWGLCACLSGWSQTKTVRQTSDKQSITFARQLDEIKREAQMTDSGKHVASTRAVGATKVINTIITCDNSANIQRELSALGITSRIITPTVLTARIPVDLSEVVTKLPGVKRLSGSLKHKPLLKEAREQMGVDKIHAGTNLDSPYDGTGVIIGVIDQGFDYKHVAFRKADGSSRILASWDRTDDTNMPITDGTSIINQNIDTYASVHGTHVAAIAAGSRLKNEDGTYRTDMPNYGVAYGADLVFFSSPFSDADILENVRYVKDLAERLGKPWVTNMSFGSQIGPHDGTTSYDKALSDMIMDGGFVVAAMGNEGKDTIHLSHTFASDTDTIFAFLKPYDEQEAFGVDFWLDTIGYDKFDFKFVVYDNNTNQIIETLPLSYFYTNDNNDTNDIVFPYVEISPNNGKANFYFTYDPSVFRTKANGRITYKDTSRYYFGVKLTAAAGVTLHGWLNTAQSGKWVKPANVSRIKAGDNQYCVSEGAASSEKVLAIASYTSSNLFSSIDGNMYTGAALYGEVNKISPFSSYGPQVGNNLPKPTVTAPGAGIKSAYNTSYSGFNIAQQESYLTDSLTAYGHTHYYGIDAGTSMATPAVAGTIALWLQAYPSLSYEQLMEVLRTTSKKDSYTGSEEWNNSWGYGKIDAYEGLVKVLQFKADNSVGIHQVRNTETPLTFKADGRAWHLLFNSNESSADIGIYNINGVKVRSKRLSDIRLGQEEIIDLGTLSAGVYVLRVTTTNSNYTRKVILQ